MNLLLKLTELSPKFNPLTKVSNFGMPFYFFRPNIEGHFAPRLNSGFSEGVVTSGAFKVGGKSSNQALSGDAVSTSGFYMSFDASDASATYSGTGVQVEALQVLVCIKI